MENLVKKSDSIILRKSIRIPYVKDKIKMRNLTNAILVFFKFMRLFNFFQVGII